MDIVGRAKRLERKTARSLDAAVGEFVTAKPVSPLEIIYRVLDRAEQEVQHAGRGQRVFPYTRVVIHVVAGRDRQARARFAVVADGPPSLRDRLRATLEGAGCRGAEVAVEVKYAARRGAHWQDADFHVEFVREDVPDVPPAPPTLPSAPPRLKLVIVRGTSAQKAHLSSGGRLDIGRRSEVLDAKGRLVRTNHIAFDEDGSEINSSVSRRHAHIEYDVNRREYRLLDDRSAHGTGIVRNGRTIPVPAGSRGVRLESGDELLFGQARMRVTLTAGAEASPASGKRTT